MKTISLLIFVCCFIYAFSLPNIKTAATPFQIGTGIYDITGPVAEIRFFGYADIAQTGQGLHLRLRSRAYDIIDQSSSNTNRVLLVVTDLWAISYEIKASVLERLEQVFPGDYRDDNVMIGCTHTHSGPGGYAENFLFNLPALGYSQQSFDVIINGIVESVIRARGNQREGRIFVNKGDLEGLQKNRSPPPYENNPEEERLRYGSDVDKELTVLKFVAEDGTEMGMIGFHAVHAVSMKMVNRLVSADNKGYAAQLFESIKGTKYSDKFGFAASFPIANAGDVSPNTGGVLETGELVGEGGEDYFESTRISATRMFEQTKNIYDKAVEEVIGPISTRSTNIDMSNTFVEKVNKTTVPAALGYSFTAGTADGIAFGMQFQGLTQVVPTLEKISKILANYSDEFQEQHNPKPILVPAGLTRPRPMVPQVLNIQLIRIGQVAIIAFPSELSTMAGRRMKETIKNELSSIGVQHVAISALTNGYAQYCVTKEEYDKQWYEGASTYFGPYTLMAYQQEYTKLAKAIRNNEIVPPGPEIVKGPVREVLPDHRFDDEVDGYDFGDVIEDVGTQSYIRGVDTVQVLFAGANPRSNLRTQDTFVSVDYFDPSISQWIRVADDSSWDTKFHWIKVSRSQSQIRIEWDIPSDVPRGTYRIVYFGDSKSRLTGRVSPFQGSSSSFNVE